MGHRSFAFVVAGGGTIAMGPKEAPGGALIIGKDPQGAEVALVGKA